MSRIRVGRSLTLVLMMFSFWGCEGQGVDVDQAPAFRIAVDGEEFIVRVVTSDQVRELQARGESGEAGVVTGSLRAGDGGFNQPWAWHLDPASVHAVDMAIELCDGRPSMVQSDVQYWVGTVRQFCPWGARVVGVVP